MGFNFRPSSAVSSLVVIQPNIPPRCCDGMEQVLLSHADITAAHWEEINILKILLLCRWKWKRENLSEQSVFWLKRPKFKHLLYVVQIVGTNCKPECITNLLCDVTCSLRPDLVNGFVRLEPCICKSRINFSFEVFKGSHATWSLCWPLYRSKFLVQFGMQMYKMCIFSFSTAKPCFYSYCH